MAQYTTGATTTVGAKFEFHSKRNEPAVLSGNFLPEPTTIALSSAVAQHERVVVNQNILNGEPYIRGTRIPLAAILDGLSEGLTSEELIEHYPRLTIEDIRAALEFAAANALAPVE